MLETFKGKFEYKKLSPQEIKERGILGRLVGPIADTTSPTRNGRGYGAKCWENVSEDPIFQEKIKNRCLFSELGHPADRTEVDMEKVCACMSEMPKKGDDGLIYGVFDILDTPNGKILKTFCDYGTTIGISSRGEGDLTTDDEGNEIVDPDSYSCETFDFVILPAVEKARMNYVTEGLDTSKIKLRKALVESLNEASEDEKRIMENTLNELKFDLGTKDAVNDESRSEIDTNDKVDDKEEEKAEDNGNSEILESLQEALKDNSNLKQDRKALQEQLAVSDAKVKSLEENIQKIKLSSNRMSEIVNENKKLSDKVSALEEEVEKHKKVIDTQKSRISKLIESKKDTLNGTNSLAESLDVSKKENVSLNEKLTSLKESYEKKINALYEQFESEKKSFEEEKEKLKEQTSKETKLKEGYKKLANDAVYRYIENKALSIGASVTEVKNKLPSSYSIKDVDRVCEELQTYKLNIGKLPFDLDSNVKVKVHKSTNESLKIGTEIDEEVDESLYRLAGLQ